MPAEVAIVRIRLLGRFAALRGSEEIPSRAFGGRRAQQLLRLLAVRQGALVPKDVIAEALWPKRPPADAGGNIEVLVSRVRRALGDRTLIQTGSGGYSLTADSRCWVDAEAFLAAVNDGRTLLAATPAEALVSFRNALEMWQGEPLAEDTYTDWAQEHRRQLSLAQLEAVESAATAALLTGDPREALTWAERALASEPLRESSAMLAVRALAASGNRAEALAAFDSFRRRLARETGLDPSPGTLELRQRVLLGQPVPLAAANEAAGPSARPPEPGPFADRQEECAAILAAATGHGPRLVVVTGPGGVGKSRLLTEAARLAQAVVLGCRGYPPDRHEAWSVAGRLLRQAAGWQARRLGCLTGKPARWQSRSPASRPCRPRPRRRRRAEPDVCVPGRGAAGRGRLPAALPDRGRRPAVGGPDQPGATGPAAAPRRPGQYGGGLPAGRSDSDAAGELRPAHRADQAPAPGAAAR